MAAIIIFHFFSWVFRIAFLTEKSFILVLSLTKWKISLPAYVFRLILLTFSPDVRSLFEPILTVVPYHHSKSNESDNLIWSTMGKFIQFWWIFTVYRAFNA
jgi:hypothetical protein